MAEELKIKKKTIFTVVGIVLIGVFIIFAARSFITNDDELVSGGNVGSNKIYQDGDFQVIDLGVANYNYDPETITVEAGKPVRIIGNMNQLQGCLRAFTIPQLGISKLFKSGDNVLEFTPEDKGSFSFSCTMGMGAGSFVVR